RPEVHPGAQLEEPGDGLLDGSGQKDGNDAVLVPGAHGLDERGLHLLVVPGAETRGTDEDRGGLALVDGGVDPGLPLLARDEVPLVQERFEPGLADQLAGQQLYHPLVASAVGEEDVVHGGPLLHHRRYRRRRLRSTGRSAAIAKSSPGTASQVMSFFGAFPCSHGGSIGSVGSPMQSASIDWHLMPSLPVLTLAAGFFRSSVPAGKAHASGVASGIASSPRRSSSRSAGPIQSPSQPRSVPSHVPEE